MKRDLRDQDRKLTALEHLSSAQCRFPIGDPRQPGFGFCGAPRPAGSTYCDHHAGRAFNPVPAPRKRVLTEENRQLRKSAW